ncbi:DUF3667 domain-containing protein [Lysobacter sp. CFH 32150]|uniref:DUF3667 domain-containing protein n=1 Tax=Lysobacter sp. CFH 32150 TaxID=2927128 RepID=UPI001FA77085|nr:DUF3667 domain-containing protein [Lysobacter sp. CFH 32150]MCI4568127.1 DUF3667 domain-containing protein [Lysobacter sp. CFH 32150]
MNATTTAVTATRDPTPPACQNCGTPLLGEHCYACGQPVKGLVRHFSSFFGDFFDSVFNIDARVFRTLWPLFAKPGYLSREYFAGHRIRFVSPVRLFVFLSIITFFMAQFAFDISGDNVNFNGRDDSDIGRATTVVQAEQRRDAALAELTKARREEHGVPGVDGALIAAEVAINRAAERRIAQLREAQGKGAPPSSEEEEEEDTISFNGKPWDAQKNPLTVSWLPDFANRWINVQVGRAKANIARLKHDPNRFKDAVLSAVPSTLFLLLPVFALLLKLAYLFKRRMYMEHLIVGLHSHAFLCLALLGLVSLNALEDWVGPKAGFLNGLLGILEALLWIWMPLYLLLMQKRIYEQGWLMTLLKYFVLGVSYLVLLSIGVVVTMAASLVWM